MVKVTKHFFIDSDESNFIVYEKTIAQKGINKGKEITVVYGYFGTFEGALLGIQKALTRKCINKYDMDISEALDRIERINERILNISEAHKNSETN